MVLLITFYLELRLASSGTELKLFKDSTISSGETSVAFSRFHGGSSGTGGATQLRGSSAFVACNGGPFGALPTSGYKVGKRLQKEYSEQGPMNEKQKEGLLE
jgi:hypothetical protein